MKTSLLLSAYLFLFSAFHLEAITQIATVVPVSKLTIGEVLSIAQKYLAKEGADEQPVSVVAIEWSSLPSTRHFETRIPGDGTILCALNTDSSDKWSWFITYIARSSGKLDRSGMLNVIRVLDSGKVEQLLGVRP